MIVTAKFPLFLSLRRKTGRSATRHSSWERYRSCLNHLVTRPFLTRSTRRFEVSCATRGARGRRRYTMNLRRELGQQFDRSSMPPTKPIVFVVDDDISVRESLELLIASAGWQPEIFASAQEFLHRPRTPVPNCLVLDLSLPGLNGLELQRRIAAERTDLPIIFITGHGDVPSTVQAMKAGATEFLTKPFSEDALLSAIRQALERSRNALDGEAEMQSLRKRYDSLTVRERQVMALVVSGLLNKQVGGELGISEITVKAHRGKVMQKMKADSLPALVKMAARLQMKSTPQD